MLNYQVITQAYPQATIIALTEFYQPQLRWQQIEQPVDAILQMGAFEAMIYNLISLGATQLGFTLEDAGKNQYTVHVPTVKLTGKSRLRSSRR